MKSFLNIARQSVLTLLVFTFSAVAILAQTTAFTYQGRLNDASAAASGSFDFQFALYDAVAGGNQQGSTQTITAVNVANGIFSVQLDFGSAPFAAGANRFLEIRVKKPADANYTTLTPRQRITSVPYAIRSLTTGTADNAASLNGQPASQYVLTNDPRLSTAGMPAAGSNFYIQNQNATPQTANFNINGTGKANIFDATTQYNLGGERIMKAETGGPFGGTNLFLGIGAGISSPSGFRNTFLGNSAGSRTTTGGSNTFLGTQAGSDNTTGYNNIFIGTISGSNNSTGFSNVLIGVQSGVIVSGSYNVGLGFQSQGNPAGTYNTVIGASSSTAVGSNNTVLGANTSAFGNAGNDIFYATAIGAGAKVKFSNTIVLGRDLGEDKVEIPGLGVAGSTTLCRNQSRQISTCSSSLRYKTNIAPFNFGLNLINRLKPITFNWKNGGMADLGLGAEDVAAVEPLLVTYNKDGQVEGVKYDRIGVVLLNAIKEQQTQIAEQRQQLVEQKALIDALRQLVCSQNPNAEVCKEK